MAPSGSPFLIFDVHYDDTFNFMPLRYENGLVYNWSVCKDNLLDLATCEVDVGLRIIENEIDLEAMYDYAQQYGIKSKSRRKTVTKDAGNMSVEELLSWAEEEAAMASKGCDDDINVTSVVDKGKGLADKGKGLVDKGKGIMNVNPTVSKDDDTDSDIDVEQRFKGSAELEEMYKGNSDFESKYSNKSVDYMSEVAGCSRPNRVYDVGESHTVIEHEEYMDKLMHQLRDKGDGLIDPFTILENDQSNEKFPIRDEQTHWKMRKPKVVEKYVDAAQLKECLTYYSLANGFSLWFYRSSKDMLIARCGMRLEKLKDIGKGKQRKHIKYPSGGRNEGSNCPFRCYGKMMVTESSFQVISLNEEHTCVRNFKYGNLVNYKWIAKHFGHKIRQNPEIKLHEIVDLVLKNYKCIVSPSQCRYAKTKALNEGEITTEEHYAMIRSYGKEILDSNDGSTVKLGVTVNPDDKTYFDRFYCCFDGLKKGFKLGCRHVIALDGCFLKKPNVGEILTAVGRDGNNHIYPIAWTVVNVENKDNWSWFLELLGKDIDMPTGNGLTLILDQHKVGFEAFTIDEHKRTCTCTMWQLAGGVKADTNVGSGGVDPGINVASVDVESSACNDTVRSANLGDFVSVRCEGTTTATTSRGRQGVKRGRGDTKSKKGNKWKHINCKRNGCTYTRCKQSQARIQQQPPQTTEEGRQAQANQNLRPRSERIMKNRLARFIDGTGLINTNAPNLD
ncbi:pentatricopeptide repeat-containing protein, partial [Tanacetum coccineum]